METLRISGLKAEALIGVHAWERRLPRPLVIDLELATDATRAAASDAIADALDYAAVAQTARDFVEASRFQLIETLAAKLAEQLQRQFALKWLRVTVHKPGAVAGVQGISVTLERGSRR